MYRAYNTRPVPRPYQHRKPPKKFGATAITICSVLIVYIAFALVRPAGQLKTTILPPVVPAQVKVHVPWPANAEAAFGANGYGLLDTNNEQTPMPTASVAKVITALSVLEKKPLKPGQTGPQITMTANDVALYN